MRKEENGKKDENRPTTVFGLKVALFLINPKKAPESVHNVG